MKTTSHSSLPQYRGNTRRRVRCQSGIMGERSRLQSRYYSEEEFASYCEIYNLASRLGYADATDAWESNPIIESSVNPSDLRKVSE